MQTVILAGELGTSLSEETQTKPKCLVEIGGMPIIWHIMKIYSYYGLTDFIICLGYRGYQVKEWFANYVLHTSDVTIDMVKNEVLIHQNKAEPWRVTLVDTGAESMTGGRLKRVAPYLRADTFCMTYCDAVANINISKLISSHFNTGAQATITAVQPPAPFGSIILSGYAVDRFEEKPSGEGGLVNGGFFVLNPSVFDYIDGDATIWEREPLETLAEQGELVAYRHGGFWQPMDALRDQKVLEDLWSTNNAPWKVW